jgi:hypothetical protein
VGVSGMCVRVGDAVGVAEAHAVKKKKRLRIRKKRRNIMKL